MGISISININNKLKILTMMKNKFNNLIYNNRNMTLMRIKF
jgi:hypothetical protein